MPNNKDDQKTGSQSSMSQSQDPGSGEGNQAKQTGPFGKGTDSKTRTDDDDMETAGGRKGNFSDEDRDSESQWSPGSTQSSDR